MSILFRQRCVTGEYNRAMHKLSIALVSTGLLIAQQRPVPVPEAQIPAAEPRSQAQAQAQAQAPKPITDAEARKVRELQLAISESQNRLLQLERQFKTEQAAFQSATGELDKQIDSLQSTYKCPDYDLDQKLQWKKKPVPQPGTDQP